MRVISFNIQFRRRERLVDLKRRMADAVHFIQELNPDFLCLQEVVPEAWPLLRAGLSPTEAEYTPRHGSESIGEAVPVLNLTDTWQMTDHETFWFSETPGQPSAAWNAAHPRICSGLQLEHPEHRPLWLMNVHLDHRSALARRNSLKMLRKRIVERHKAGYEIICCGDFNMPPYRREMLAFMARLPSISDAVHWHPVEQMTPTFLGWGPFKFSKARIDRCLHSHGWHADHYQVLKPDYAGRRLSDHCAVVVDFSARKR